MISTETAESTIRRHLKRLPSENVTLDQAAGRILAEEVKASFPSPRFHNSAMDGFAVRWQDTASATPDDPARLKVVGVVAAGSSEIKPLENGTCVQIMTGGEIPPGADAVVIVEHTSGYDSDPVEIFKPVKKGENIRYKGEEISTGKVLIRKGSLISPAEMGVLATFGIAHPFVAKKPRVAVLGLGDELIEPGEDLGDGKIYNSNLHVICSLVKTSGGEVVMKQLVPDDPEQIRRFFREALKWADILISTGGVSMGRFDHVKTIFGELRIEEQFWKVAQKPGKPFFFGTFEDKLIFGLPGNPVSSFIGYLKYIHPSLLYMCGGEEPRKIYASVSGRLPVDDKKRRFLFGYCGADDKGVLHCRAATKTGSHMITSGLGANCIIEVPPSSRQLKSGDNVALTMLPWGKIGGWHNE